MKKIVNSNLHYQGAGDKGLGVFANVNLNGGTLLAEDIFRTLNDSDLASVRNTGLYHHLFVDRKTYENSPEDCRLHVAFGPISIVNHSETPNCRLKWIYGDQHSYVSLISVRDIRKNEEITIFYKNINQYDFANEKSNHPILAK